MTGWIVTGVLYVLALVFFRLLGGFGSAADAIRTWGRSTADRRLGRVSPTS